jgi:hypothetical protein
VSHVRKLLTPRQPLVLSQGSAAEPQLVSAAGPPSALKNCIRPARSDAGTVPASPLGTRCASTSGSTRRELLGSAVAADAPTRTTEQNTKMLNMR